MSNQSYRLKIPQVSHSARHTIAYGPETQPLQIDYRVGGWLPRDHRIIERYIAKLLEKVKQDNRVLDELSPSIVQFKNLIDNDPILRMGFTEMFDQVPRKPPYDLDPTLKPQAS